MTFEDIAENGPSADFQTTDHDESATAPALPDTPDGTGPEAPAHESASDTPDGTPAEAPNKKRFKSHDEAEEGYRNLQAEFTRRSQKLADLEKREKDIRERVERQRTFEERAERMRGEGEKLHKSLMDRISRLDPDDPAYQDQSAKAWADYHVAMDRARFQLAESAAPERRDTREYSAKDLETIRNTVMDRLSEAKLGPDDPVFLGFATQVDASSPDLSLEERTLEAIKRTTEYKNKAVAEARAKASRPLSRGGTGRPADSSEPARDISIAESIAMARRRRAA